VIYFESAFSSLIYFHSPADSEGFETYKVRNKSRVTLLGIWKSERLLPVSACVPVEKGVQEPANLEWKSDDD